MNSLQPLSPLLAHCTFEKASTPQTLTFDAVVLLGSAIALFCFQRMVPRLWLRFLATAAAVFVFELFTGPMWLNEHLGRFAYVYTDVSWILTVGWTTLILGVVILVDRYLRNWSERKRFGAYLLILLGPVLVAEIATVQLDIRSYSQEVRDVVSGVRIAGVPIEILYYVPVFTALVIAFYKYWSFMLDDVALVPVRKRKWLRGIALAFIGVFAFELLVEPMVSNEKLPEWSYVYRDISVLMTGTWVLLIAVAAVLLGRYLLTLSLPQRFAIAILIISSLALPMESWLINHGYRVYGHSAVSNFTGYKTFVTGIPVEVAFAIPCYLMLIVAFIRYWEVVLDNRL